MSNRSLYATTVLIWGSTWLAIEFQLGVVAPEVSVFYRYTLAALLLFGWCRLRGLGLAFGARAHLRFALLGLLLFSLNYIVMYHAQRHVDSALAAIVFSTMLWMNIANARLFFGVRSGPRVLLGSVLGIAGVVVLFLPRVRSVSLADATLFGALLCVAGAFIASLGNMVSQLAQNERLPVLQANAWGMFYGALLTGGIALALGTPFGFDRSLGYVASLAYLAVFGSILAFGAYLTLLGRIGAHRAGYAVVTFPAVALVLSVSFEGLEISASIIAGILLVMAGNVVILQRVPATPKPTHGLPTALAGHRLQDRR